MFKLPKNNQIQTDIPQIKSNYTILHFDEEPILYVGKNKYGGYVLGSAIDEDIVRKIEWNFRTLISAKCYLDFINKKISYLEILKNSSDIFMLEKAFDKSFTNTFSVSFKDIPEDYLPSDDSYCPDPYRFASISHSHTLHLDGQNAFRNMILPNSLKNILDSYSKVVIAPFSIVGRYLSKLVAKPYISAFGEGSFTIKFNIIVEKMDKQRKLYELLTDQEKDVFVLSEKYLRYCFNDLIDEYEQIIKENNAPIFNNILDDFKDYTTKTLLSVPEDLASRFTYETKKIFSTIYDISEGVGYDFDTIDIEGTHPISRIDSTYKKKYENIIKKTESVLSEIDESSCEYTLHIYKLNVETRKGTANIRKEDDSDYMYRANFKVTGNEPLDNTKYTSSLHENKFIKILGKATRIKGEIKSLLIDYED